MSRITRSFVLFVFVLFVLPLLLGVACDNGGGDSIGEKVDKAVGDGIKDIADGLENLPSPGDAVGIGGALGEALDSATSND